MTTLHHDKQIAVREDIFSKKNPKEKKMIRAQLKGDSELVAIMQRTVEHVSLPSKGATKRVHTISYANIENGFVCLFVGLSLTSRRQSL